MPLTTIDNHKALIVIDLQKGIVGLPTAGSGFEVVERSAQLAKAFREKGSHVVWVNVTQGPSGRIDQVRPTHSFPPDWTELVPELDMHPDDYLVSKKCISAFNGTSLDDYLRQRGVTQVFVTGVATSIGVEGTARSAYDLGYNVVLVADAMTDLHAEAHQYSVEKIFPRIGEVTSTEDLLKKLEVRS
jgi:nicotinamidase-related amidase